MTNQTKETQSIKVFEWRSSEHVYVEVTEEPILIVDGNQSWFEVDTRFENGDEYYAVYDEVNLRWETGSN